MRGIPLAGRPSGLITQLEFMDRAEALAAAAAPGSDNARRAAILLMRDALHSHGYGAGLAVLEPYLGSLAEDTAAAPAPEM